MNFTTKPENRIRTNISIKKTVSTHNESWFLHNSFFYCNNPLIYVPLWLQNYAWVEFKLEKPTYTISYGYAWRNSVIFFLFKNADASFDLYDIHINHQSNLSMKYISSNVVFVQTSCVDFIISDDLN